MRVKQDPATTVLAAAPDAAMRYARLVFAVIALGSAATLVGAFVLQRIDPHLVNGIVWLRAGFFTVGGAWLWSLAGAARRRGDRAAFVRIRIVSVLSPIGIAALVIAPDSGYPLWMKAEQLVFGLLMVPLAIAVFTKPVATAFPPKPRVETGGAA